MLRGRIRTLEGESNEDIFRRIEYPCKNIIVRVDPHDVIDETDENNNEMVIPADNSCSLPDIVPFEFRMINQEEVEQGKQAVYELVVQNIGEETAEGITWRIIGNRTGRTYAWSGRAPIMELEPGHKMALYPSFECPCEELKAYVDAGNFILESDESNNVAEISELCCEIARGVNASGNEKPKITKKDEPSNNIKVIPISNINTKKTTSTKNVKVTEDKKTTDTQNIYKKPSIWDYSKKKLKITK